MEYVNPWAEDVEEPKQYTPRKIYDYLNHQYRRKAAYVALGITMDGTKVVLLDSNVAHAGRTWVRGRHTLSLSITH